MRTLDPTFEYLPEIYRKRRKPCLQNRDTHRVMLSVDIHACNTCGGWETKGYETQHVEMQILHEPACPFYPSPANLELENGLRKNGTFENCKWDNGIARHGRDEAGIEY